MQRIGYMIYETAEGEKNRGFVSMFAQAGKAYGLRFCLAGFCDQSDQRS